MPYTTNSNRTIILILVLTQFGVCVVGCGPQTADQLRQSRALRSHDFRCYHESGLSLREIVARYVVNRMRHLKGKEEGN